MSDVGYKKPPVHTRFGAGNKANPQGKTSKQKKSEMANAEKATLIRGRLLDAVVKATAGKVSLNVIEAGILRLLKDAEDRGLGTPVQSVNIESPEGSMSPTRPALDLSTLSIQTLRELSELKRRVSST